MVSSAEDRATQTKRNRLVVGVCAATVLLMVGLSYASVPLYRLFCQVTGYGGTPQRAEAGPGSIIEDSRIKIRFDSNVSPGLNWKFSPEQREVDAALGEQKLIYYRAVNNSDKPVTGMATFNVTPERAGFYFNKIDCFCFTEQTLKPGESVDMPVLFFVDEEIAKDEDTAGIRTVTLSYTFYNKDGDKLVPPQDKDQSSRRPSLGASDKTGAEGHG
ncbi:cytochrome c oxidase assembly protein [Rhodoligotrophos appendicifer]|uniref:cytochrome c oxidase assembly protein n=1 Tax=Rhodoligotrophos appendicifer TaxID=987056 RepID=UPI0011860E8D|nr:cytochrome c oxidase assembly protein [Rhodoligotrophos appendicifer]